MSPVSTSRPGVRPARNAGAKPQLSARAATSTTSHKPASGGSIDHWTMILFYALGVGVLALVLFFMLTLMAIGLYGQFVWAFTQWDLASVRSEIVKPWAQVILWMVFAAGTGVGLWFFSGYAWKHLESRRIVNAATRRR